MAGVSDNENKNWAVKQIEAVKPHTVLDIGAGMGIYSIMNKKRGQHWTALEVFAPYVEMFNLNNKYEQVIIADARYANYKKLGDFDLMIAADMLEHMPKDDAKMLLNKLMQHCKFILICFPVVHHDQAAGYENNPFEMHVDHWDYEEMEEFLSERQIVNSIKGDTLAYFMVEGCL